MMEEMVREFVCLSDQMRPGYRASLGTPQEGWERFILAKAGFVPKVFQAVYGQFAGTRRELEDQRLMDFIPGYRLIHAGELESEYRHLLNLLEPDDICEAQIETFMPLLADYASCYVLYAKRRDQVELVFSYSPDGGLVRMHDSAERFLETIIAFYRENVYFLDSNGFLDYDFEQQGIVGKRYNPGVAYWSE